MMGDTVSKPSGQGFFSKLFGSKSSEGYYVITGIHDGETVNLYRGANSFSPIYTSLKKGDQVYRYDAKVDASGWCRVEYEDVSAWIETRYLKRA